MNFTRLALFEEVTWHPVGHHEDDLHGISCAGGVRGLLDDGLGSDTHMAMRRPEAGTEAGTQLHNAVRCAWDRHHHHRHKFNLTPHDDGRLHAGGGWWTM